MALLTASLSSNIMARLIGSGISAIVIFICTLIVFWLIQRKLESVRQKKRLRSRVTYIATFIFVLVLAKIWVEGFAHMLTMFSLISAGLVVTNKETIMNFVGWLIINWRGLFVEGDYIQVQNYSGYIYSIGPLYFDIYETNKTAPYKATGKHIKVPNGLIITCPTVIYSPESSFGYHCFSFSIKADVDIEVTVALMKDILKKIVVNYHDEAVIKKIKTQFKKNRILSENFNLEPDISISIKDDISEKVFVLAEYYCRASHQKKIEEAFLTALLTHSADSKLSLD